MLDIFLSIPCCWPDKKVLASEELILFIHLPKKMNESDKNLPINLLVQEREIRRINSDIEKQIKRDKREATRQYNTVQYSTIQLYSTVQ